MGVRSRTPDGGARRAYYPSGPWINGVKPPGYDSGRPSPPPPPAKPEPPNPDPTNYKVLRAEQVGAFLIVKIHYPGCTNYEGNKVLVFKGVTAIDLLNQRVIDPHFFEHKTVASPVARFRPNDEGWAMAVKLAQVLTKG